MSNSLGPHGPWNSPGQNTGVGSPSPGDLPNLGIEPRSHAFQADSLPTKLSGKHECLVNICWMNEQLNQYAPKYVTWVLKHWSWFPISNYLQRTVTHGIMEEYFKEDHLNIDKYFSSNTFDLWTMKRVKGAVHFCSWKSMYCHLCLKN